MIFRPDQEVIYSDIVGNDHLMTIINRKFSLLPLGFLYDGRLVEMEPSKLHGIWYIREDDEQHNGKVYAASSRRMKLGFIYPAGGSKLIVPDGDKVYMFDRKDRSIISTRKLE